LEPIKDLRRLSKLQVSFNQLKSLEPISNLRSSLKLLEFTGNQVADISPLRDFKKLIYVIAGVNQIKDLSPLSNLTSLQAIAFWANKIENIEPLSTLPNLRLLNLASNFISDLQPIKELKYIQTLAIAGNPIGKDLCPLEAKSRVISEFCEKIEFQIAK
jgi:internalin A